VLCECCLRELVRTVCREPGCDGFLIL
jgi:hypothetical protein